MAFLMVRIECPGDSVADMNAVLNGGDDTNPQSILNNLVDLVAGIASRNPSAQVDLAVRETTESISADGDGVTASCNQL